MERLRRAVRVDVERCHSRGTRISAEEPHPHRAALRVGILDDHAVIVDGLASWIEERADDLDVVIRTTRWLPCGTPSSRVDPVLMDLQLDESISIESRIRACRAAGAAVVVVTALDDDASRDRSSPRARARSSQRRSRCPNSSRSRGGSRAASGWRAPSRDIRRPKPSPRRRPRRRHAGAPADADLSDAERRALVLYAQGLSTAEVARAHVDRLRDREDVPAAGA